MHYTSLYAFRDFYKQYFEHRRNEKLRFLDVGSMKMGRMGVFGRYLRHPNWEVIGLDMAPGPNVDIVATDPYHYPFEDNSFDLVLSGSTMEHVEDIYAWTKELARLTRDMVWILVPNKCKEHKYPIDCWRVFPDGMRFILKEIAGLEVVSAHMSNHEPMETIGIAKKIIK